MCFNGCYRNALHNNVVVVFISKLVKEKQLLVSNIVN